MEHDDIKVSSVDPLTTLRCWVFRNDEGIAYPGRRVSVQVWCSKVSNTPCLWGWGGVGGAVVEGSRCTVRSESACFQDSEAQG
jgi:hypothetical protein